LQDYLGQVSLLLAGALASALGLLLRERIRRNGTGYTAKEQKTVDQRAWHALGNFTMMLRPVLEAAADNDTKRTYEQIELLEERIRNRDKPLGPG
jgi:hypothetical protein